MHSRVAVVYNEPVPSRYDVRGEDRAVVGVLDAIAAVHRALLELGCDVVRVPLIPPLEPAREKLKSLAVDLVFNLFEGFCGYPETEVLVPEIATEMGLPYTGCSAEVLKLALDKAKTKAMLEAAGIATPSYQLLSPKTLSQFYLGYPCIVKPAAEDASHGISEESVVTDFPSLEKQVTMVSNFYGGGALVEEFIDGQEFNVTVLGSSECTALPVSEIVYSLPSECLRLLTFAAKWQPDSLYFRETQAVCPAQIPARDREHIAEMARVVFRRLIGRGYARVDMRLGKEGWLRVIEVNPNPDISPGAGAVRQAEAAGMSYTQFVEKLVLMALQRT